MMMMTMTSFQEDFSNIKVRITSGSILNRPQNDPTASKPQEALYTIYLARGGGWIRERFEVLLTSFSEEFSNIKHQLLDMKMMMMMPRGAPEQKHPKRGKSKKKL